MKQTCRSTCPGTGPVRSKHDALFLKKKWYPSGIENESRLVGKIVITSQLDSNHQMGVGANLFIKVLPHLITINIVAKA